MKLQSFHQIGKRSKNEDSLGHNDYVVCVCDGMGGHAAGEIASRNVVKNILKLGEKYSGNISKDDIQTDLKKIQQLLNSVLNDKPELNNMGTTLTALFRNKDKYYAAYIGDSRIYFIRPSERKIWHTWDHSFVGNLVKDGVITRENGRFHPMGNRISRAIVANKENKTVNADIFEINEIKQGDYMLLCSDGVSESWSDYDLINLIASDKTIEEKNIAIAQQCDNNSKDNNTAYLIEFEVNDVLQSDNNKEITWIDFDVIKQDYDKYLEQQKESEENKLDDAPIIEEKPIENKVDNDITLVKPKQKKKKKGANSLLLILLVIFGIGILGLSYLYLDQKEIINKEKAVIDSVTDINDSLRLYNSSLETDLSNAIEQRENLVESDSIDNE